MPFKPVTRLFLSTYADMEITNKHSYFLNNMRFIEPGHLVKKQGAVWLYAIALSVSVLLNKSFVQSNKKLPATTTVLVEQTFLTLVSLYFIKTLKIIKLPAFNKQSAEKVYILPMLQFGIVTCSLASSNLSRQVFEPLQRLSIIMTITVEILMFGQSSSKSNLSSVCFMVIGGLIGLAATITHFNLGGWLFVIAQDILVAVHLVSLKKALYAGDLGKYGVIFYSNILMLPLAIALCFFTGEMHLAYNFTWSCASIMQFISVSAYNAFTMLVFVTCAQLNSASTTAVVPCVQQLVVAFGELVSSTDEVYELKFEYFIGSIVSLLACVAYFHFEFQDSTTQTASKGYEKLDDSFHVDEDV